MFKRIASGALWFLVTGWALNYLTFVIPLPSGVVLGVAAGASAFVGLDPFRLFWPVPKHAPAPSTVTPDVAHPRVLSGI